jgi:hypothetical protein
MEFNVKKTAIIVGAELAAPAISIGAVYSAQKFLEPAKTAVTNFVAKHIVEPNLDLFKKLGKNALKAHHSETKGKLNSIEDGIAPSSPVPFDEMPKEQQAFKISNVLCNGGIAMAVEMSASYALQKIAAKVLNEKNSNPAKVVFTDCAVNLVSIFTFSTIGAGVAEGVRNNIDGFLKDTVKMNDKNAESLASAITYVNIPSVMGIVASVMGDHKRNHAI